MKTEARRYYIIRLLTRLRLSASAWLRTLWPTLTWTGFYAGLALWGLTTTMQPYAGIVFWVIWVVFIAKGFKHLNSYLPTDHEIDRAIETSSKALHRPLALCKEETVLSDGTSPLWQRAREKALQIVSTMRSGKASPFITRSDPYGLRFLALMVLVSGFITAGPLSGHRLAEGFVPIGGVFMPQSDETIKLWVTPPDYTGLGEISVEGRGISEHVIDVPENSRVKVRVKSGFLSRLVPPVLQTDNTAFDLSKISEDGQVWEVDLDMPDTGRLRVKQLGLTLFEIPLKIIKDQKPEIHKDGEPELLSKGGFYLPLKVRDDYGLAKLEVRVSELKENLSPHFGASVTKTRPLAIGKSDAPQKIRPLLDFSDHPWAGLDVILSVIVQDTAQQSAEPLIYEMTLPQRQFTNPLAQAINESRKLLIWEPVQQLEEVWANLENILTRPDLFNYDLMVTLGLRSASSRLRYNQDNVEQVGTTLPLLWETALRLDDGGNLQMAAQKVSRAQQKLAELMQDENATEEEIARAMMQLEEALQEYFHEMAKMMAQMDSLTPETMPDDMSAVQFSQSELAQEMAAYMEELARKIRQGDTEGAREMMAQLQDMMDRMGSAMTSQMPEAMQDMMEAADKMRTLIAQQKALRTQIKDRTGEERVPPQLAPTLPFDGEPFPEWNTGNQAPPMPGQDPPPASSEHMIDLKAERSQQDGLRDDLQEIMSLIGASNPIPENLSKAEQLMRDAAQKLSESEGWEAIRIQNEVISLLEQTQQSMQQQLQQMMAGMTLLQFGMPRDPMGRPIRPDGNENGFLPSSVIEIPDESTRKRAYEIREKLRERLNDRERPQEERNYFERLLRRF